MDKVFCWNIHRNNY